jgi:predicted Fe-Mo cluster-binding NifX family protein
VNEAKGLESEVYGHFGSAPAFIVVDSETKDVKQISNSDASHAHGMCSPLKALNGQEVDCVVVGGIGGGALTKLGMTGISVYRAESGTIETNLASLSSGKLQKFDSTHTCAGHGGDCAH